MKYIEYIDKLAALNYLCELAETRGLSANNLVQDFVDKSNFIKVRNGKTKKVSLDLIMHLANKLGKNIEDVFRATSPANPDFFDAIDSIQFYNKLQDFKTSKHLLELVKKKYSNDIDNSIEVSQIVLWSEGIIEINLNKDIYLAIEKFKLALSINSKNFTFDSFSPLNYTEIEIGIVNSILICYNIIDKSNINIKLIYEKLIEFLESKHIDDYEIAFNIYYEYYFVCTKHNIELQELLEITKTAADLAITYGITNKLPFIYYQIALIYTDLGDKDNMEEYYSTAIFLYKQIGVPEAYLNKIIANREECRKIVKKTKSHK